MVYINTPNGFLLGVFYYFDGEELSISLSESLLIRV